jgi:carboxyl-terminal processing protease
VPDIAVAQGDETTPVPALERYSEADLPHHLIAENTTAAPALVPIKPPPGKKIDDFQLSYALDLLNGRAEANTVAQTENSK